MKKCPFCGTALPEEAVYCLNCSSVLNERETVTTDKKKPIIIPGKKIANIVAIACAVVIIFSSCFLAIKSIRTHNPDVQDGTLPPQTSLVAVTEENGEIATNDDGAQIFEVTEITETTTKKGFFDILFNKEETEKNNNTDKAENSNANIDETECTTATNKTESNSGNQQATSTTEVRTTIIDTRPTTETTTKKSFWDIIAGIDTPTLPEYETTTKKPTTTKPTTTTTKPATTTTKPATTTTTKPATTTTKPATTTTTKPTTTTPAQPSATDFEYVEINGEIKITKYTGNSATVTVPAYIDGKHVAFLGENAFAGNSNIKKIVFTGTTSGKDKFYLPKSRVVFNNLANLTSITFPYETNYRMTDDSKQVGNDTFYDMIINCPNLSGIYFTDKVNSDYSSSMLTMYSVDGVVFSRKNTSTVDSYLIYYPPAKSNSSYTVPSRVWSLEKFGFSDNPYIQSIHFTASTNYIAANFLGCKNLTQFTVDENHQKLFAEDGVLYTGSATVNGIAYKSFFYPPGKKDISYTFTDKHNLAMDGYSFCGNPYIKTAKFCCGALIYRDLQNGPGRPTALTSIQLNNAYTNSVSTDKNAPFTITYY